MKQKEQNSENVKDVIYAEAVRQFYEKGYVDTTLSGIAHACGISKGLISYYYGSKVNLALQVFFNFKMGIKAAIEEKYLTKYGSYDILLITALEARVSSQMYNEDEKALDFLMHISRLSMGSVKEDLSDKIYTIFDSRYNIRTLGCSDELTLLAEAIGGAITKLTLAYHYGVFDCSYEEFEDYRVAARFIMMRMDNEQIKKIVEESREIHRELNFIVQPYFKVE